MKQAKILIFLISVLTLFIFISCDDAGQNPSLIPKGQISLSHLNLKTLDPVANGLYTLWLSIDSSGTIVWYNLGQFNINAYSQIVDAQGNIMVFEFPGDTNMLDFSKVATITVGNSGPLGTVIVSNVLTVNSDSVTGTLWMAHADAFGDVGRRILGDGYPVAYGYYHISTPTANNNPCKQGIWFSDTLGNNLFSDGLALAPGNGWVYEGWLQDENTNSFYSTGRFYDPYNADLDGAGLCAGSSGPPFNRPGQDWITTGTGCPSVSILINGSFGVFISVEPEDETGQALANPFFLKIFYQNNIVVDCKRVDNIFNQSVVGAMPRARLRITN